MYGTYCEPKFTRPSIKQPEIKLNAREKKFAKDLAGEINRVTALAAGDRGQRMDPCSLGHAMKTRLDGMDRKSQAAAVQAARKALKATRTPIAGEPDLSPELIKTARQLMRRRIAQLRPALQPVIDSVVEQGRRFEPHFPKTTVEMRPAGESIASWTKYMQVDEPPSLMFH